MLHSIPELERQGPAHSTHDQWHNSGQSRDFVSKPSHSSECAAGPRLQSWPRSAFTVCIDRIRDWRGRGAQLRDEVRDEGRPSGEVSGEAAGGRHQKSPHGPAPPR